MTTPSPFAQITPGETRPPAPMAVLRGRAAAALAERYPFPDTMTELLDEWYRVANEIARHNPQGTRKSMDGLGDPAGPRQWRDAGGVAYKVFLVYFLPVAGKPINHNLHVEFGLRGGVVIAGASHAGGRIELANRYAEHPERFGPDLRAAARFVGLLPGEAVLTTTGQDPS